MLRFFNRQSAPVDPVPEIDDVTLERLLKQAKSGDHIETVEFFSCLSDAIHAQDRVEYRTTGKVSQSSPLYELSEHHNQKLLNIFEAYFDPKFFDDGASIKAEWELIPDEIKKVSLRVTDGEDIYVTTPAVVYRNARVKKAAEEARAPKSAELLDIRDFQPEELEAVIA